MSEKSDISRRKVLWTTSSIGSAVMGFPAVAAGKSGDKTNQFDMTEEEVKKALAETGVHLTNGSSEGQSSVNSQSPDVTDAAKIYVGEYKNADTPTGKPFAIENYEEYLAREAPPGFGPNYDQNSSIATEKISTRGIPSFYLKEDIGSVSLAGHTFTVGFGVGVKIKSSGANISASLSADIYLNGFSVSIASFSVGYGITGKGVCIRNFGIKYEILQLEVDVCINISFTGSKLSIGGSVKLCADSCPAIKCEACKSLGVNLVKTNIPNL